MKVKFWGTRGSITVTGLHHCKYGGNTPCIEVSFDDNSVIILDAGSGIRELGLDLLKRVSQKKIFLFFSHFHTDHIIGLPFFTPFYRPEFDIDVYGNPYVYNSIEDIIDLILKPPLFAVTRDEFKSIVKYHNIDNQFKFETEKFSIEVIQLNHPSPTLGYKIKNENKTIVYFTDNELIQNNHSIDELERLLLDNHSELISFCKDSDILIHDSSYSIYDYSQRIGWGHSSNLAAAMFAHLARVKNLYLFHFDPQYSDDEIDNLLEETNQFLQKIQSDVKCSASSDFLELTL